jgi:hypothetical protein
MKRKTNMKRKHNGCRECSKKTHKSEKRDRGNAYTRKKKRKTKRRGYIARKRKAKKVRKWQKKMKPRGKIVSKSLVARR